MANFHVIISVSNLTGARFEDVSVLVDTGATLTKVPRSLLATLGIAPTDRQPVQKANGQMIKRDIGEAMIRLNGRSTANPVAFAESGEEPLLGSVTLQSLGLGVDTINERLIPIALLEMTVCP